MPISFVFIGIMIIYIMFYVQKSFYKNGLLVLLITILIGFFVPEINFTSGILINVFILMPIIILDVCFILKLNKKILVTLFVLLLISGILYSLIILFNIEFSTLFNSLYAFIITSTIAIICCPKNILCVSYIITNFIVCDILNVIFIKNVTNVVPLLSVDVLDCISIVIVISFAISKLFNFCILKYSKEKSNV